MVQKQVRTITLRGVRVHNLKSIDLDLPHHRVIAITGVSGSGKSSLAFDTLYAEGQRRYIETFSPYIRQFLEKLDKPDAERLDGIPPAIASAQRQIKRSARSTVGSVTEIDHALAILFARMGRVVCPGCQAEVRPANPNLAGQTIEGLPEGTRYQISFPVNPGTHPDPRGLTQSLKQDGFQRVIIEGQTQLIEEVKEAETSKNWDIVVDRLVLGKETTRRRQDSLETAFRRGGGRCRVHTDTGVLNFESGWRCGACEQDFLAPDPRLFRPSSPLGACPSCQGSGQVNTIDMDQVVSDPSRSLADGAVQPWTSPAYRKWYTALLSWAAQEGIRTDVPFHQIDSDQQHRILTGSNGFGGLEGFFASLEKKANQRPVRVFLSQWRNLEPCPACHGSRLRPESLAVRVSGKNIAEIMALPIPEARATLEAFEVSSEGGHAATRILKNVLDRLGFLERIGLGYLSLDRTVRSLSAGEIRRASLTAALGSGLVNTLYVLDEPSLGLHPADLPKLVTAIRRLCNLGNTVVVVDHKEALMRSADHLVDIGPGAGEAGGRVVYSGPPNLAHTAQGSTTGDFLAGRIAAPSSHPRRKPTAEPLKLIGATRNNLKNLDVTFPLGIFCVVAGVSGSGKSTLVEETLLPALLQQLKKQQVSSGSFRKLQGAGSIDDVILIDQSPIGRSPRSNPITHLKAFDEIRRTFASTHEAKLRNYGPSAFSFNVQGGRCTTCEGNGHQVVDMQFLPDVLVRCPECRGTRYRSEILEVMYGGKTIAEVLDLTARAAFGFFRNKPKVQARLRPLLEVGLDYIRLGQPANTLSGGEAQRLKLAAHLAESPLNSPAAGKGPKSLFLMDEPTTGLHPSDICRLLDCLNALVDRGHSLIVVEHSPQVLAAADWIIELGPGPGAHGGQIVAQGTPEQMAKFQTPTGRVVSEIREAYRANSAPGASPASQPETQSSRSRDGS